MGIYLGKVEHELREFHKPDLMSHRECRTYNGLHLAVESRQLIAESQPFVEQLMACSILVEMISAHTRVSGQNTE